MQLTKNFEETCSLLVCMRNFFPEKLSLKSRLFFLYLELDYSLWLLCLSIRFIRQEQWIRGARYASSWGRLIPMHRDINNRWTHLITLLSMHSTSISLPPSQWYWSPWTLQVSACWDHSLSLAMTTLRPAMPKWNSQTSEFLLRTCCWEKDEASRLLRWLTQSEFLTPPMVVLVAQPVHQKECHNHTCGRIK